MSASLYIVITDWQQRETQFQQFLGNGAEVNNYFGGKGLELIPTTSNEIPINVPAFEQRTQVVRKGMNVAPATGFADWNFLTVKQRLLSANEENGNYIVSAFLGFQAPTGAPAFTNKAWLITPTIAGKGWVISMFRGRLACRSRPPTSMQSARRS